MSNHHDNCYTTIHALHIDNIVRVEVKKKARKNKRIFGFGGTEIIFTVR